MYVGFHVKYRKFCQILMKHEFARHVFEKFSDTKFHENLSIASRVVPCGWAGGRPIAVGSCTSANAPERRVQYNLSWITMRLRRRTGVISSNLHALQLQNTAFFFSCHCVCR